MFLIMILGGGIGTFLLILVYCIPIERIFTNFSSGIEGMERDENWYRMIYDYDASTLDNYTQGLMLKAAATPLPQNGENIIQQTMRVYMLNDKSDIHGSKYIDYTWNGKQYSCDSYERYWHGYLIFLKPLLFLFPLHDIVFLNIVVQLFLVFAVITLLQRKNVCELQIPFVFLWIIGMQMTAMFNIDLSVCFYIYMLAIIILLKKNWYISRYYYYYFLVIGMCTSFFDFLTWPLVTLGIPLIVYMYITNHKNKVKTISFASICWGSGYLGLWCLKWGLSSVILQENVFSNAIAQLQLRSSSFINAEATEKILYIDVLVKNFSVFGKKVFILLFIVIAFWLLYKYISSGKKLVLKRMLPYILISFYPFLWYLFTKNHSYEHYWMTWRELLIPIFAMICGTLKSIYGEKQQLK
ncbi:MAG: hypothetical protein ACLRZ9_13100 [Eubacterium sp.]